MFCCHPRYLKPLNLIEVISGFKNWGIRECCAGGHSNDQYIKFHYKGSNSYLFLELPKKGKKNQVTCTLFVRLWQCPCLHLRNPSGYWQRHFDDFGRFCPDLTTSDGSKFPKTCPDLCVYSPLTLFILSILKSLNKLFPLTWLQLWRLSGCRDPSWVLRLTKFTLLFWRYRGAETPHDWHIDLPLETHFNS